MFKAFWAKVIALANYMLYLAGARERAQGGDEAI